MSKNKLIVPEARAALNQFKMEMAKELGISNYNPLNNGYLASYHTGRITKKLVEMGEKQLLDR
ncbi:alpha/beta-type small acid-soluble spore protein [Paramaledivibacter caminithermalis]|uniref:Small acid-soluble spore protein D (Minor alpha/beta-type SASP) n=1 Tax=Paramaledivibacter caminithermalis (strain DSM 15212 / CIP 107654 / DViRD3) TaxID=1121301 RepID=A0A1M6MPA1_PARC5|nr:alpha/beta-type small acid-soluble spore protein [Paramaledivibacter caminithermalis]SHJ85113.1 small acid-soluble spore protein D (minor alpha/beta-type SASP) [Paramaledivibacter caminithermalis DSM 15212]